MQKQQCTTIRPISCTTYTIGYTHILISHETLAAFVLLMQLLMQQLYRRQDGSSLRRKLPSSGSREGFELGQERSDADTRRIVLVPTRFLRVISVRFAAEETRGGNDVILADVTLQLVPDETFRVATIRQNMINVIQHGWTKITNSRKYVNGLPRNVLAFNATCRNFLRFLHFLYRFYKF